MWIFLSNSFLSIIGTGAVLTVRSRVKGDIERVFPAAEVHETFEADYPYRAFITRSMVAYTMQREVMKISTTSFKDSVPKEESKRHSAYMEVWQAMSRFGDSMLSKKDQKRRMKEWEIRFRK